MLAANIVKSTCTPLVAFSMNSRVFHPQAHPGCLGFAPETALIARTFKTSPQPGYQFLINLYFCKKMKVT